MLKFFNCKSVELWSVENLNLIYKQVYNSRYNFLWSELKPIFPFFHSRFFNPSLVIMFVISFIQECPHRPLPVLFGVVQINNLQLPLIYCFFKYLYILKFECLDVRFRKSMSIAIIVSVHLEPYSKLQVLAKKRDNPKYSTREEYNFYIFSENFSRR